MVERADQCQRRLHLRRFDAMTRLQLIHIQPRNHRQLAAHLRQRNHAQTRIQRLHHIAVRVELKHRHRDAAGRIGARDVHLRHRIALRHVDFQRARQDALDGDGTDRRNQLQIPLHRRQIERNQIVAELHPRPPAQLLQRNHAVGFHLNVLDGKLGVFIDEFVQRPLARAPEQIKTEHRAEQDARRQRRQPRARRAHLVGTQFHVQNVPAMQPPVFMFAPKPHKLHFCSGAL